MRLLAGIIAAVIVLSAPAVASARDAEVRSFDGTSISVHFFPAKGLKESERAPTVLLGHGWGFYRVVAAATDMYGRGAVVRRRARLR